WCFVCVCDYSSLFFFFQAEDGIRDRNVTGVQTCALPIFPAVQQNMAVGLLHTGSVGSLQKGNQVADVGVDIAVRQQAQKVHSLRSEERRVGKECRSRLKE